MAGRGLSAYASSDIQRIAGHKSGEIAAILGYRGRDEIIHRDDLVLSVSGPGMNDARPWSQAGRTRRHDGRAWPQGARGGGACSRSASSDAKVTALKAAAAAVRGRQNEILAANADDVAAAKASGIGAALLDRLAPRPEAAGGRRQGAGEDIAALPDLVGRVLDERTRPNGLRISRVAVPLGVIGIIYESRPNVIADAGGLALKSGNAAILRGGSDELCSSRALVAALQDGLRAAGLPGRRRSSSCRPAIRDAVGHACSG